MKPPCSGTGGAEMAPTCEYYEGRPLRDTFCEAPQWRPRAAVIAGHKERDAAGAFAKKVHHFRVTLKQKGGSGKFCTGNFFGDFFLHWRVQGWSKRPCPPPPQSLEGGPTYILPLPPKKTTASNRQTAINFPNFFKRVLKVVFSRGKIKNIQKK